MESVQALGTLLALPFPSLLPPLSPHGGPAGAAPVSRTGQNPSEPAPPGSGQRRPLLTEPLLVPGHRHLIQKGLEKRKTRGFLSFPQIAGVDCE